MRRSRRKVRWPSCGKPIQPISPTDQKLNDRVVKQRQRVRMLEIMNFYGIKDGPDAWYQLALKLASERDIALRVVDYKPPVSDWKGGAGYALVYRVKTIREKTGGTELDALRQLVKTDDFFNKFSIAVLKTRLAEAKKYFLRRKRTWDGRAVTDQ